MNNKKLEKICRMSQNDLKRYAKKQLSRDYNNIIVSDGFVFAKGAIPVLLIAHLDTVHRELPKKIIYDKRDNTISSPSGIGGDDRCGIYAILEIVKQYNCSVLFTEDEEIGGIGADKFADSEICKSFNCNYIIELDRRGKNDAVFYEDDNTDFHKFVCKEYFRESHGTFSDISILAPVMGRSAVNLSCGYYNAHTRDEYIKLDELQNTIAAVCALLARSDNTVYHYIEKPTARYSWYDDYGSYSLYGEYDYTDTKQNVKNDEYTFTYEKHGIIETETLYANSYYEAVGIFCEWHDDIPYKNIIEIA